jgi:N utilization substance protein A
MLNKFREAEAIIPYREQNHREHFHQGEPIRAVLKRVEETPKGPRLVPEPRRSALRQGALQARGAEIQQNIVEIRAGRPRSRQPHEDRGLLTRRLDSTPSGACVGLKGSRVQAVVNELNGERIDIVPWSPDPERFAKLALAPAKVARVFSDPATKTIQAVVDEDQLSLAIGRNGQNVRLASELTGWKIDLYSSREWMERGGEAQLFAPLPERDRADGRRSPVRHRGHAAGDGGRPRGGGYRTLNDIIDLEREDFLKLPGIAPEEADRIMAMIDELTTEDVAATGPRRKRRNNAA